jgi:hypothetical protein
MMYVVFAAMLTADEKAACCQPEAVSVEKLTDASFVPVLDHKVPTWVPVFPAPLKKRTPVTDPATSE